MSVHGDDTRPYGWRGTFQFQNSKIAKITNLLGLEGQPKVDGTNINFYFR